MVMDPRGLFNLLIEMWWANGPGENRTPVSAVQMRCSATRPRAQIMFNIIPYLAPLIKTLRFRGVLLSFSLSLCASHFTLFASIEQLPRWSVADYFKRLFGGIYDRIQAKIFRVNSL